MTPRPVRIVTTWLCLVTCLLGGMVQERGYVLCLGMDGHIGVSPSGDACSNCEGGSNPSDTGSCPDEAGFSPRPSCCPCLDIPVPSVGSVTRHETAQSPLP